MPNLPTLLATCLLLASVPGATAIAGDTVFTADLVKAVGPDPGELSGPLAVFVLADTNKTGTAPPVPRFTLDATSMRMEIDASASGVRVQDGVLVYPVPAQTEDSEHTDAAMWETGNRDGYELHINKTRDHPAPTVSVSGGCFELGSVAQGEETFTEESKVDNDSRAPIVVDLRDALRVRSCGDTTLRVRGAFLLHLWQVDAVLREGGSQTTVQSGHLPHSAPPGQLPPDGQPPVEAGRGQEVYITVRDGTLTIPFTPEAEMYARTLSGELDGTVILEGANGRIETGIDTVPVQEKKVQMRGGPMQFTAAGHGGDPVEVTMAGGWKEAEVGDQRLTPAPASQGAAAAPVALAVLTLAAMASSRRR